MRLNSIRTRCKPFSLHQPIWTCHIKLLLKLIVKSIHPDTSNNISIKIKNKNKPSNKSQLPSREDIKI